MEIPTAGMINWLKSSRASRSGDLELPDWVPEGEEFSALSWRAPTAPPAPKNYPRTPIPLNFGGDLVLQDPPAGICPSGAVLSQNILFSFID